MLVPTLLALTAAPQLRTVAPDTASWRFETVAEVPFDSPPVALFTTADTDGDQRSELVVELADGKRRWIASSQPSLARVEERGFPAVRGADLAESALPEGRYLDPAWQPSQSFGREWLRLDVDGEGDSEVLVADPESKVAGAQKADGALLAFRDDGVCLARCRGLRGAWIALDAAQGGRFARVAFVTANSSIEIVELVPRSRVSVWSRWNARAFPAFFGPASQVRGLALHAKGSGASNDDQGVHLEVAEQPGTIEGLLPRARDGYWLSKVTTDGLRELRAEVGEEVLLVADEGAELSQAPLLQGVHLTWDARVEHPRSFEARLLRWEQSLRAPQVIAVSLQLPEGSPAEQRRAWTWLVARHGGYLSGLPAELPEGRLGQPKEGWFHDESGTIQRDFEGGRPVSTLVSWSPTRVRMEGPFASLVTGQVAWEHLFPRGYSDVLLSLEAPSR